MAADPQQFQVEGYQLLTGTFVPPEPPLYYQIHGRPAFAYSDIWLQPGKRVLVDGEGMLWMDSKLDIETDCYGGWKAGCMRECSGETCCMNSFGGSGKVAVGFHTPGDILAFAVDGTNEWLVSAGAFIAGTDNIKVTGTFGGCMACCCAEEGPYLTLIKIDQEKGGGDQGVFLAGGYGMIERNEIPQGQRFYCAAGTFFATHAKRSLSVGLAGGCTNYCFGAGGKAIVLKFEGPCVVYTQSRNPADLNRLQMAGAQEETGEQNDLGGNEGGGDQE